MQLYNSITEEFTHYAKGLVHRNSFDSPMSAETWAHLVFPQKENGPGKEME